MKKDRVGVVQAGSRVGLATPEAGAVRVVWEDDSRYPGDLQTLIAEGRSLSEIAALVEAGDLCDLADLTFCPPLARPGKIICVGVNYHDHIAETDWTPPVFPEIFLRTSSSLTGADATFEVPDDANIDYEGELVAVIGRTARHVAPEDALDYVAGYSIFNDITRREWQFRTTQWTLGKNLDRSGAFGPWLVDAGSVEPGAAGLRLTTRLNGEIVQDATTDDLIYGVAKIVSAVSSAMTLDAGDIIVTGTPGGVGMARKPPLWMKPGDVVEVTIGDLGQLRTFIA